MRKWFHRSNILNLIGLLVIFYLSAVVFQTVKHNYDLSQQINLMQSQIDQLNSREAELKYEVQYFQTDAFKEKQARAKLGLMQPGEGVIILPPQTKPAPVDQTSQKPAAKPKTNPHQWWQFLFG